MSVRNESGTAGLQPRAHLCCYRPTLVLSGALGSPEPQEPETPGFRGHFVTKSRGYSTTLGALRDAYRAERDQPADADEDSALIVAAWEYIGSGYLNRR